MSDDLQEIKKRLERLELLISVLLMHEVTKNDPKFMKTLQNMLKEHPAGYFDDLWEKYKSEMPDNPSKLSQIEMLNEKLNKVDELFTDLKNSTEELAPKKNKS